MCQNGTVFAHLAIAFVVNIFDVAPPLSFSLFTLIHFLVHADLSQIFKNDISTQKFFVVGVVSTILTASKAVLVGVVFFALVAF